jgi:C1A family cysteine protease
MAKEIEELKAAIKEKQYDWTPAETSVSKLSGAEQKNRLGLLVTDAELEEMRTSIELETGKELELLSMMTAELREKISYPAAFDWRNYNGKDWTLPVRDQGSCGSCVAFGTVAAIESTMKIASKTPNLAVNLSEAFLLFCGGGSCSGWSLEPPLNFAKSTGITDEACFPYQPKNMPCSDRCSDWTSREKKIKSWTKLSTITQRKNWISSKGPVTGGMAIYADFSSYSGGVYRHTSERSAGYARTVGVPDGETMDISR